ncbi:MAG: hypothetical protein ACQEUZ_07375 [Pseudomonadota bacterium]
MPEKIDPRTLGDVHYDAVFLHGLATAADRLSDDVTGVEDSEALDGLMAVLRELKANSRRLADDLERLERAQRRQAAA